MGFQLLPAFLLCSLFFLKLCRDLFFSLFQAPKNRPNSGLHFPFTWRLPRTVFPHFFFFCFSDFIVPLCQVNAFLLDAVSPRSQSRVKGHFSFGMFPTVQLDGYGFIQSSYSPARLLPRRTLPNFQLPANPMSLPKTPPQSTYLSIFLGLESPPNVRLPNFPATTWTTGR